MTSQVVEELAIYGVDAAAAEFEDKLLAATEQEMSVGTTLLSEPLTQIDEARPSGAVASPIDLLLT